MLAVPVSNLPSVPHKISPGEVLKRTNFSNQKIILRQLYSAKYTALSAFYALHCQTRRSGWLWKSPVFNLLQYSTCWVQNYFVIAAAYRCCSVVVSLSLPRCHMFSWAVFGIFHCFKALDDYVETGRGKLKNVNDIKFILSIGSTTIISLMWFVETPKDGLRVNSF